MEGLVTMVKRNGKQATKNIDNLSMPIDQYGRYGIVAEKIKELMATKGQEKVTILDIGGYKGEIHRFFKESEASITVLDLYDCDDLNYVKGSALDLPFKDGAFDYTVSFEVFEHIPRKDRAQFIKEAIRVSKGAFVLTAPFAGGNNEVLQSEIYVNDLWKKLHHENHPWLYEHISYKTPKTEELESILKMQELAFKKTGNNELVLWNLMLSFNYITTLFRPSGLNPDIHRFYNENVDILESHASHYYRYVYVIGEDSEKVTLAKTNAVPYVEKVQKTSELINKVFLGIAEDIKEKANLKQKELDKVSKELELRISLHDSLQEETMRIQGLLELERNSYPLKVAKKIKSKPGRKQN